MILNPSPLYFYLDCDPDPRQATQKHSAMGALPKYQGLPR